MSSFSLRSLRLHFLPLAFPSSLDLARTCLPPLPLQLSSMRCIIKCDASCSASIDPCKSGAACSHFEFGRKRKYVAFSVDLPQTSIPHFLHTSTKLHLLTDKKKNTHYKQRKWLPAVSQLLYAMFLLGFIGYEDRGSERRLRGMQWNNPKSSHIWFINSCQFWFLDVEQLWPANSSFDWFNFLIIVYCMYMHTCSSPCLSHMYSSPSL